MPVFEDSRGGVSPTGGASAAHVLGDRVIDARQPEAAA